MGGESEQKVASLRTSPYSSADEPARSGERHQKEPRAVLLREDIGALSSELYAIERKRGGQTWEGRDPNCPCCRMVRRERLLEAEDRGITCAG